MTPIFFTTYRKTLSPKLSMKSKVLAVGYICLLVVIVYFADLRRYQFLFRPVRRIPYGDKISHFILMGLLSFAVNLLFQGGQFRWGRLQLLKGSLIVAIVVTLEEISQLFIQYRTFDLVDLAFDYAGIFLFGQLAYYLIKRRARKSGTPS